MIFNYELRNDDKPSAEPNLFELCRGAKEFFFGTEKITNYEL
jgi:hypothetical protein